MIKIGKKLLEKRISLGLSLEEVAKATKIRVSFLNAIENGEYKKLPSSAYVVGFVKNYVEFLGLPMEETMALFRREFNEKELRRVLPEGFGKKDIPIRSFKLGQPGIVVIGLFVILSLYITYQYRYAFMNPPLSIQMPTENGTYQTSLVVEGSTDANAVVLVNDMPTSVQNDGSFKKSITVFPGDETIVIKSTSRFGRETTIQRHVVIKE